MTTLYRVFRHVAHAHQFVAGELRFGHLGYYRGLEDSGARGDTSEGQAHHTEFRADRPAVHISGGQAREVVSPGMVSVHTDCGNDVFVCCLTQPPDHAAWQRVRKDFGDVVVELDAERLLEDVRSALDAADPWQRGACVMLWPVEYTKGLERARSILRDRESRAVRLAVTQKPPCFAHQHEHRIALISYGTWEEDGAPPDFLTVRVPHRLDYAQIVSVSIATAR
jgi:hypothetical protein